MRNGHTLWEMLVAVAIMGSVAGTVLPIAQRLRDRAAVRATAAALRATLATARDAALTRATPTLLVLNTSRNSATIVAGADTILDQPIDPSPERRSRLFASRNTVRYGPTGRAFGASNTTLIIQLGAAAETVTVSRLGRVRGSHQQ